MLIYFLAKETEVVFLCSYVIVIPSDLLNLFLLSPICELNPLIILRSQRIHGAHQVLYKVTRSGELVSHEAHYS